MKRNQIDIQGYKPKINEVGEIDIDAVRPRESEVGRRGYLALIGCAILVVIMVIVFILPAFSMSRICL